MPYLKHPSLGSRDAGEEEACELEAQGWTRFPRSAEAKALGAWPPEVVTVTTAFIPEAPIKRKPGRPRKVIA